MGLPKLHQPRTAPTYTIVSFDPFRLDDGGCGRNRILGEYLHLSHCSYCSFPLRWTPPPSFVEIVFPPVRCRVTFHEHKCHDSPHMISKTESWIISDFKPSQDVVGNYPFICNHHHHCHHPHAGNQGCQQARSRWESLQKELHQHRKLKSNFVINYITENVFRIPMPCSGIREIPSMGNLLCGQNTWRL